MFNAYVIAFSAAAPADGMSLTYIPAMMSAMSGVRPEESGLASGIVNTTYQVGSVLGLAAMTAIATSRGGAELENLPALTDGFRPPSSEPEPWPPPVRRTDPVLMRTPNQATRTRPEEPQSAGV